MQGELFEKCIDTDKIGVRRMLHIHTVSSILEMPWLYTRIKIGKCIRSTLCDAPRAVIAVVP